MPEEWLELAFINFDKTILHGRVISGGYGRGCRIEREVEQSLTAEQKDRLGALQIRQGDEMQKLLRSFVTEMEVEPEPVEAPRP
jgi:hypothetical protein